MDADPLIRGLERHTEVFAALLADVDAEQARWKPSDREWALVEVAAHLADEEGRDFRARVKHVLGRTPGPWPSIDPVRWVSDEAYLERDLTAEVDRFRDERRRSVLWLRSLSDPDWSLAYDHPSLGSLSAGDLLASWLAHDLIHVRQINRLQRQYLERVLAPERRVDYAGDW